MDFKFIIILGLVSLLILYIINEFKLLKSHIATSNENTTKLIKTKFNILLNDIRELNTDLVNQTKKINKIHSQNITSMSNYFTDSEHDGKQVLQYLSENKDNKIEDDVNFKIDFGEIKNVKTNDNDIISNSSIDNLELLKNKDNISVTSEDISEKGRLSQTLVKNKDDNNSEKSNKSNSNKSNSSKVITGLKQNVDIEHIKSESKSIKSEESIAKSIAKLSTAVNENDNNSEDNKDDNKNNKDDNFQNNKNNKDDNSEDNKNNKDNNNSEDKSGKISIENNQVKSMHGLISFGSRKSKGTKLKINIGENKDNKSLESEEIKSIKELNNIETYNKKDLENIAKIYNIQTFYKNGNTRKQYNKEELYIKIQEKIKNK